MIHPMKRTGQWQVKALLSLTCYQAIVKALVAVGRVGAMHVLWVHKSQAGNHQAYFMSVGGEQLTRVFLWGQSCGSCMCGPGVSLLLTCMICMGGHYIMICMGVHYIMNSG